MQSIKAWVLVGCILTNGCSTANRNPILSDRATYDNKKCDPSKNIITHPHSPVDILINANIAWRNNIILDDSFYSDAKILMLSGGKRVIRITGEPPNIHAFVEGFQDMPGVTIRGNTLPAMQYDLFRYTQPSGNLTAGIRISFLDKVKELSFARVENIFGADWQEYPDPIPAPHRFFPKATHPHGNDRIRYVRNSIGVTRFLVIEFQEDGHLQSASFTEEAR